MKSLLQSNPYLADPARRKAMGRAARARVDAVFDIRHHVAAMDGLFAQLLGLPPARMPAGTAAVA